MIPGRCIECGSLPVTKPGARVLECVRCGGLLCDGCALFAVEGEAVVLTGEEVTDKERAAYPAFCAEHEGTLPISRRSP